MKFLLIATILSLSSITVASESVSLRTIEKVMKTNILTNDQGMTLYTFDEDSLNQSNCDAGCLSVWPAHTTDSPETVQSPFSTIEIEGGGHHVLINGKPLYTFVSDRAPGDINGDNLGGVWHIVKFSGSN